MAIRISRGDPGDEAARRSILWNDVVPPRYPDVIVAPERRSEVAAAVRAGISAGHRIAVKSGGHNWLGASLRDGGLLLDLGRLRTTVVDAAASTATIEPGATHKVLADAIVPHGLAFPIGHCPSVGIGGYLLAGGAGWNLHEWGPGCWNVTGADVVTADGEEAFIDEDEADLLWAVRGGSGGFPGIVSRFHLRLHPLPEIRARRLSFPLASLAALVPWVAARLAELPPGLEISVIVRQPLERGDDRPLATMALTGFGRTPDEAARRIALGLDGLPLADDVLLDSGLAEVRLNDLEGEGGWREGLRYAADTCWARDRYAEIGSLVADAMEAAPSRLSRTVLAFGFMPESGPDCAFTRLGDVTINMYATWQRAGDDAANVDWLRAHMTGLESIKTGHYIGETDITVDPERLAGAYPPAKLERLRQLAQVHDPGGRFHGFLERSQGGAGAVRA